MDAILSLIFLSVLFVVIYPFAFHYWQQGNYKLLCWWGTGTLVCLALGIFFAGRFYLRSPSIVIKKVPAKGKAYVYVSEAALEPLKQNDPIILTIIVENTGTVEAEGYLKDITCHFAYVEPRSLTYSSFPQKNFKLVPSQKTSIRYPFETMKLDDWQLKLLNTGDAQLYFFGRGEFRDESGNISDLTFCRAYTTLHAGNLVFCNEDITFDEPQPVGH
jgi:hypothetical protein